MAHNETERLRTFHLFAGAGGGILADLLLGHIPVGACEIEDFPRAVLLQRQRDGVLPEFPIWDDVCTLDGRPWRGSVDVLCGGFPCQDISSAGKGVGISGERSGLWKEYARLIDEIRPHFVFAENSPMLRTRGLNVVLSDLSKLGYDARWCVLGACDVGAPHKRDRMWVCARRQDVFSHTYDNGYGRREQQPDSLKEEENSNTVQIRSQADRVCENVREKGSDWKADRDNRPNDSRGRWWETESSVDRMADGVANRVDRIKAIGNGQVPEVARLAWEVLTA